MISTVVSLGCGLELRLLLSAPNCAVVGLMTTIIIQMSGVIRIPSRHVSYLDDL